MSCASPLTQYNKYLNKTLTIPCNRCINCRIDKRNSWVDRCNYALKQYNFAGAFVTFTYDDYHLYDPSLEGSCHYTDSSLSPDGKSYVTLNKKDVSRLIMRIRSYLNYHKINTPLSDPHFKYLAVGEYGGEYGRPHLHILFFGLDFAANKHIFNKCWKSGIVDVRPILNGGIPYVLKYLDKQLYGDQLFDAYDKYNIQAPFKTQSPSLGSDLYRDSVSSGFAASHSNCYRTKHNRLRPIPSYWRKKLLTPNENYIKIDLDSFIHQYNSDALSESQLQYLHPGKPNYINPHSAQYNFTFKEYNLRRSKIRENILTEYCRRNNIPVNDPSSYSTLSDNGRFRIDKFDVPRVPNTWLEVLNYEL